MKSLLFVILFSTIAFCNTNAQVFKFRHRLSQDLLKNSGYTLHQGLKRDVLNSSIVAGIDYSLLFRLPVTIKNNGSCISIQINSGAAILKNTTTGIVQIPTIGVPIPLIVNNDYTIEATNSTQSTTFTVNNVVPCACPACVATQRIETDIVELVAPTKGIITVSGGKILFDVWQISSFPSPALGGILDINATTPLPLEIKSDRITVKDPTKVFKVPYEHFSISVISIPFRYRGRKILADTVHSPITVSTSINAALSCGYTWGKSHITTRSRNDYSFTLGAFLGPSSVDLKSTNVKNPSSFSGKNISNPVLVYGVNGIFARNSFGVLIAVGMDNALGKNSRYWIYNNSLWVGLGLSLSFPRA